MSQGLNHGEWGLDFTRISFDIPDYLKKISTLSFLQRENQEHDVCWSFSKMVLFV